jgi:hypothetical protein
VTPAQAVLDLLESRGPGKTICPSEAARRMAIAKDGEDTRWRENMDDIHRAVDILLAAGDVNLSRKGKPLVQRRGAYRIARR